MSDFPIFISFLTAGALTLVIILMVAFMRSILYVCAPNEILIFSGMKRVTPEGREVGFRVIHGGRGFRVPILEKVDRMDMRLITVPMTVRNAYSEGGIPLTVNAIANIKISSDEQYRGNAIERFLGHKPQSIARVAKETLEGHLRGVVATMTPEEVNEDRLKFAEQMAVEAVGDLQKLGLQLDTLKIQAVADDRGYLDSIGRARIAEVLRLAEVAESDASKETKEFEAKAKSEAEVAERQVETQVTEMSNELRRFVAEMNARALASEQQVPAKNRAAEAKSEAELQEVRTELERVRLEADVVLPAEANRQAEQLRAIGHSASIAEQGKALATSTELVSEAWKQAGPHAKELMLIQNLDAILESVVDVAKNTCIAETSIVDSGDGESISRFVAAYPPAGCSMRCLRPLAMRCLVSRRQLPN